MLVFVARCLSKEEVCFDQLEMNMYAKIVRWIRSDRFTLHEYLIIN
jgi:hypothetical protein